MHIYKDEYITHLYKGGECARAQCVCALSLKKKKKLSRHGLPVSKSENPWPSRNKTPGPGLPLTNLSSPFSCAAMLLLGSTAHETIYSAKNANSTVKLSIVFFFFFVYGKYNYQ